MNASRRQFLQRAGALAASLPLAPSPGSHARVAGPAPVPAPVADAFGQRIRGEWPGKVTRVEELRAHLRAEAG